MSLGIAVVTYQRLHRLERLIPLLREMTESPHELVVADDGSDDGTAAWAREQGLRVITGPNRGVCWNKNRGLYALAALGCDPLLLFEDDVEPTAQGWERAWIEGTARWHHLAFAHPKIATTIVAGDGSPQRPFVNNKATAQCSSISAQALREVGYLDTRFKGYGVGHAEWTTRIKRARYGYQEITLPDGRRAKANLYLTGGLVAHDEPSHRDNVQVVANKELFRAIKREPIYRDPWSTPEERADFLAEQDQAGIQTRSTPA